jgi:hypothetical protein
MKSQSKLSIYNMPSQAVFKCGNEICVMNIRNNENFEATQMEYLELGVGGYVYVKCYFQIVQNSVVQLFI